MKERNKLGISILLVFILLVTSITAQEKPPEEDGTYVTSSDIQSQFSDPSIKLSFRSWGEGRETTINLDDYFIGQRKSDNRFLFISPPEIDITIDQETSLAVLKSRGRWIGTKEVVFTQSSIYNLEKSIIELEDFESELIKKRIPPKIKNEIETLRDAPAFNMLENIIDSLEKRKSQKTPEITARFAQNRLSVNVGEDIDLSVGIQTETQGIKTKKPELSLNIRPGQVDGAEEELEESAFPIVLLFPIILIGGSLLLVLGIYIVRNKRSIKQMVPKVKQTKPELLAKNIKIIANYRNEVKEVKSKLNSIPIEKSAKKSFEIIQNFFDTLTNPNFEFTYSEIKKEILEEGLNKQTENFLIKFSKELVDFKYSNQAASKQGLSQVLNKVNKAIEMSVKDLSKIQLQEEVKLEKKRPIINLVVKLRNYLKGTELPKTPEKKDEKVHSTKKKHSTLSTSIFKRIFSFSKRTSAKEVEKIALQKYEAKERKKTENRTKIEHFLKEFFHKNFGLFKTQKEINQIRENKRKIALAKERAKLKIIEKKRKEKQLRKLQRRHAIKKFFHDIFGLYKTSKEIESEKEERRKLKLEKERIAREIKLAKLRAKKKKSDEFKNFFRIYFGLFKSKEEVEKEIRTRLLARQKKKIARQQATLNFFRKLGLFKTDGEIQSEREAKLLKERLKERLKEEKRREKLRIRTTKKRARIAFFHDNFGLFKTQEEKETIIRAKFEETRREENKKLREKREVQREKEEKERLKEKEKTRIQELKNKIKLQKRKAFYSFIHNTLGIKTLKEKHLEKIREARLKLKTVKEKRKIKEEKQQRFRSFFHDNFGLYRTHEEKEYYAIKKLKDKRRKSIARRKAFLTYCHDKLGLFKTKSEIENEKERKLRLETKVKKEKIKTKIERRRAWRKFFHNNFGLYKTKEELQLLREREREKRIRSQNKKIREAKASLTKRHLRNKAIHKFLHNLGFFKTKEELQKLRLEKRLDKRKHERSKLRNLKRREKRQLEIKKYLHDHFGLFRTRDEKIKLEIKNRKEKQRKRELKLKLEFEKEKIRKKRRELIHGFLHDKLGFFKTYKEKQKEERRKKVKKLELENKVTERFSFFKKLFKKDEITKSDELHVLIKLEQNAIRRGEIKKAKQLQRKINKIYKKINFQKNHPTLTRDYNIIKNSLKSFKSVESQTSFTSKIKSLFSKEPEKNKIDEILFLINRCEKSLNSNRRRDSQDLFARIVNMYSKLNNTSKKIIEKNILNLRSETAAILVKESLEKAHESLREGRIKEAKTLYKEIKQNFYYLPLRHRENLLEHKNSLSEKLQKKKKFIISLPRIPIPEFNILTFYNLQKEKMMDKFKELKIVSKVKPLKEKESLTNYLLARKPKFISIQTNTIPKSQIRKNRKRTVREIFKHIDIGHSHLKRKDHLRAKEKYKEVLELFKDSSHELPLEFQKLVHRKLKPLKEKILHVSLKNFMSEINLAIKKGEHSTAKELEKKVKSIYSHLSKTETLPFTPPKSSFKQINDLINSLDPNSKKANQNYKKITSIYNTLSIRQKRQVYSKMLKAYKEIVEN